MVLETLNDLKREFLEEQTNLLIEDGYTINDLEVIWLQEVTGLATNNLQDLRKALYRTEFVETFYEFLQAKGLTGTVEDMQREYYDVASSSSFEAPLLSNLLLNQGAGNATFSRNSIATFRDHDGIIRQVPANEARFLGARRVKNLLKDKFIDTEDLTTAWGVLASAVIDSATQVSFAADALSRVQISAVLTGDYNGRTYIGRARIWCNSGTEKFRFRISHVGDGSYDSDDITITTTPTDYYYLAEFGDVGTSVNFAIMNASDAAARSINITNTQFEEVTAQLNKNPSEYVSCNVLSSPFHGAGLDGVKYFPIKNGNVVSGNTIKSSNSAAIPDITLKGYLCEPESQNILAYSETLSSWTNGWSGGTTLTSNALIAPNGLLSATKIAQIDGTGDACDQNTITLASSTTHTVSGFFKNNDSVTSRLIIWDNNAGSANSKLEFDWLGGVPTTVSSTGCSNVKYEVYPNGWYRISYGFTTPGTVTTFRVLINPEFDSVATNSIFVWGMQLEALAFPTSYIPTSGSATTRLKDELSYGSANISNTDNSIYAEVTPQYDDIDSARDFNIVSIRNADSIAGIYLRDDTGATDELKMSDSGSASRGQINIRDFDKDQTLKIAGYWDSTNSEVYLANSEGFTGAGSSYSGTIHASGVEGVYIFKSTNTRPCCIRNLKLWKDIVLSQTKINRLVGVDNYLPTQIGGCVFWIDPSDASTVTLNGADISQIDDKSGLDNHATQGTAVNQPLYNLEALKNLNCINFTGAEFLSANAVASYFTGTDAVTTMSYVFKANSLPTTNTAAVIISNGNSSNATRMHWFGLYGGSGYRVSKRDDAGVQDTENVSSEDTNTHVISYVNKGTTVDVWLDGLKLASDVVVDVGDVTLNRFSIGALVRTTEANNFTGEVGEIIVHNRQLTKSEIKEQHNYLMQKWTTKPTDFDIFLIVGQSNAQGRGDSATSIAINQGVGYEINNGTSFTAMADPVGNANTGSAWPSFASMWHERTRRGSFWIEEATGGTAVLEAADSGNGNWSPNGTLLAAAEDSFKEALALILDKTSFKISSRYACWSQGERESQAINGTTVTADLYEVALKELFTTFINDLKLNKVLLFELGATDNATYVTEFNDIRAAQVNVANSITKVLDVYSGAKDFPSLNRMFDTLHYNQTGYNDMGHTGAFNTSNNQ